MDKGKVREAMMGERLSAGLLGVGVGMWFGLSLGKIAAVVGIVLVLIGAIGLPYFHSRVKRYYYTR